MDKAQLQDKGDMLRAKRLKDLQQQSGWQDVKGILNEFWNEGFEILRGRAGISGDTEKLVSANIKMNVVESLCQKLEMYLDFGEKAQQKFNRSK